MSLKDHDLNSLINTKRDEKELSQLKKPKVNEEMKKLSEYFKSQITDEETIYNCDICKDREFVECSKEESQLSDFIIENVNDVATERFVYLKKCSCLVKKEFEINMRRSGMNQILDKVLNEKYETKYDWQKEYHDLMTKFVKSKDTGFIMSGQTGSGKTLLMGKALLNLLHLGKEVHYLDWRNDFTKKLVNQYNKQDENHLKYMDYLCNVEVLYIDDLFKVLGNSIDDISKKYAQLDIADTIISRRCESKHKKTIITMELFPDDIANIDSSFQGRLLQMLSFKNENWVCMNKNEERNIRVEKFNNKF